MHAVADLVPNHTSDQHIWFQKSVRKEHPFSDYYMWRDAKPGSTEKHRIPPNNWVNEFITYHDSIMISF